MGVIGRFTKGVKKYMAEADQRADKRLAQAKTKSAREKELSKIKRERLVTKREVTQAKTALLQAEAKRKKAAKEVRDIGGGDVFSSLRDYFGPKKTRKRTTRRKTTRRR